MSTEVSRQPTARNTTEIVVGVDGSDATPPAVRYALEEARRHHARVRLVHVVPQYSPLPVRSLITGDALVEHGRAILAEITERARATVPGVDIHKTLAIGPRGAELARAGQDASMVVLGRRSHPRRYLLTTASTATALAANLTCPVRVVPATWTPAAVTGPVLVGVKTIESAAALVERGLELAAESGVPLVLVHAWHLPPGYDDVITGGDVAAWSADTAAELAQAIKPLRRVHRDVEVRFDVRPGRPAEVLGQLSAKASLVLVGRHAHRRPVGYLGRVPRAVVQISRAPVELGPGPSVPELSLDLVLEREGTLLK